MSRVPLKKRKYVIAAATDDFPPDYEASCASSGRSSYPDSPPDLPTLTSPGRTSHSGSPQDSPPFVSHERSSNPDPLSELATLNSPPQTPPAVHGCGSTSQPLPFRHQRHKSHSPSSYYAHETLAPQYPEPIPEFVNSSAGSSISASPRQHSLATNPSPGLSSGYSPLWSRVSPTYPASSSPRIPSYPSTASPHQSNYSSSPSPMSSSYNSHPCRVASNYSSSTLSPMMSEYSLGTSPAGSDYHYQSASQFRHERKEHFSLDYHSASCEISPGGVSSNPTEPIHSELVTEHPQNAPSPPSQVLTRFDLPKDLVNFLPPNLLQSVGISASSSDSKCDKKHRAKKFSYRIGGKLLNATARQKSVDSRQRSSLVTKTLCSSLVSDSEQEAGKESLQRDRSSYKFLRGTENNPSETLTPSRLLSNFDNLSGGTKVPITLRTNGPDQEFVPSECSVVPSFTVRQDDQAPHPNMGGVKRKKQQQCRYCTNHNIFVPVKGHKYNCEYRDCVCECCIITRQRQIAVREQQKQTRRQESQRAMRHVEEESRLPAPPHPPGYPTPPQYQHYGEDSNVGSSSPAAQRFSDAEHRFSQEYIEGN